MPYATDARVAIIFQCPPVMRDELHALAKSGGETTATLLRRMVDETLKANGRARSFQATVAPLQLRDAR